MKRPSRALIIAIMLVAVPAHGQPLPDGFDLVPREAAAAAVIPSLKRASDDFTRLLEGMERANVLLGARPMDQIRAVFGLQAGVNELASAAIVLLESDPPASPVFVIPVTNASDFIDGNFDPDPSGADNAFIYADGTTMYLRELSNHVAMCADTRTLQQYSPGDQFRAALTATLSPRAIRSMHNSEIIFYANAAFAESMTRQSRSVVPGVAPLPIDLFEGAEYGVITVNFDALGVGVNTFATMREGSAQAEQARGGETRVPTLSRLPHKPFYLAGGVDFGGLGGAEAFEQLFDTVGFELPEWIETVAGAQLAISPSPLGLQGGLLNEAVLHIATDSPEKTIAFIAEQMMEEPVERSGVRATPKWMPAARDVAGISVNAYEVAVEFIEPDPTSQMLYTLVFGRRGLNGFVGAVDNGVIMTFSQRPDVFTSAVQAARGDETLGDDPTLRAIRAWLPPDPDVEVFLGVGTFGKLINQLGAMLPIDAAALPQIDSATKPIAMGVEVSDGTVETAWVIPADAMSLFFDLAAEQFTRLNRDMIDRETGGE